MCKRFSKIFCFLVGHRFTSKYVEECERCSFNWYDGKEVTIPYIFWRIKTEIKNWVIFKFYAIKYKLGSKKDDDIPF